MNRATEKMPALFVGHGSPMNAIEDNRYTQQWQSVAQKLPRPLAILAISAHWYTSGSRVTDVAMPEILYDMYGFPPELYQVKYPVPGAPELAHQVKHLLGEDLQVDNSWGCDHGAWSVLCRMYPQADIPVVQLSVNRDAGARTHFQIGEKLRPLREQGVLILGSGNVVHNLSRISWAMRGGYPWASEFDRYIREHIICGDYDPVIDYQQAGESATLACPMPDHFYPLLYVLGAATSAEKPTVFNDSCTLGSLSMTSYLFY